MKNYIGPGDTVQFVASGAVTSGDIVVSNELVGIAMGDVDWLPQTKNVLVAYGALLDRETIDQVEFCSLHRGRCLGRDADEIQALAWRRYVRVISSTGARRVIPD